MHPAETSCVPSPPTHPALLPSRSYVPGNRTKWENYAFGLELALHESLLSSPHRTLNPRDADFFFVPVMGGCFISRFTRPTPRHNLYVTKVRGGEGGVILVCFSSRASKLYT